MASHFAMKILPLALASVIAALAAFVVYQFSFPVSVSLLFAGGVAAIALADYRRTPVPVRVAAIVARPFSERLRLAA